MTTTYIYLQNAERELRQALKTTVDTAKAYQLRRIAETISTISDISQSFKDTKDESLVSIFDEIKHDGGFDYTPPAFGDTYIFGATGTDTITFGSK